MIPFHWLFVIIAGGSILILFTMFISVGKESSENGLAADLMLHFDTIFNSLVTTEQTQATIPSHRDIEMSFTCLASDEENVDSYFRMNNGFSRPIENLVLFAQGTVGGEEIFTNTVAYEIPFGVSSLLYLTDENTLYIVDTQNPAIRASFVNLLPRNASIIQLGTPEYIALSVVDFSGYRNVVIIAPGTNFNALKYQLPPERVGGADVYLYHVKYEGSDPLSGGEIVGYQLETFQGSVQTFVADEVSVPYESAQMLAGAIMSDSVKFYECARIKLLGKIQRVSRVLAQRAALLLAEYSGTPKEACISSYRLAEQDFAALAENPAAYVDKWDQFAEYNRRLELQSCPLLY